MALTPFDMEGVNRDLLAAGNPAKPDMQSILRRNARDLVLGNAILVSSVDAKELEFGVHMAYSDADGRRLRHRSERGRVVRGVLAPDSQ